jgi:hypothetical protein
MSQTKKKPHLKKRVARIFILIAQWSVIMGLLGVSLYYLMNMILNRGLHVDTHEVLSDIEEEADAWDFVTPFDDTEITVSFLEEPVQQLGFQEVTIVVQNKYGRCRMYKQTLQYAEFDKTPPVISGVHEIIVNVGDTISYMEGVTAVDETDGEVAVHVEKSSVNTREEGTYTITYSASDTAGNITAVQTSVTVTELTAEQRQLYALADSVLAKITNDSMSMAEKAYAIYQYTHERINYTGARLASDWDTEAFTGLSNIESTGSSSGDCHTYYAVANVLLQRIGAQTMLVERRNSSEGNRHYWILCNIGSGWYHFDATRISGGFTCFMLTDSQLLEYNSVQAGFYDFDSDNYPATADTPFQWQ